PQFTDAESFADGRALVKVSANEGQGDSEELYGFIEKTGAPVIKPQFAEAFSFSDGLAPVKTPRRGPLVDKPGEECADKWGYIDKSGEFVIRPQFEEAGMFSEGLADVKTADGETGYIDKSGKLVLKVNYNGGFLRFSGGLAPVMVRTSSMISFADGG